MFKLNIYYAYTSLYGQKQILNKIKRVRFRFFIKRDKSFVLNDYEYLILGHGRFGSMEIKHVEI